jgi:TorA maturation chaperone TorD
MNVQQDEWREAAQEIIQVNEGRAGFYRMLASLYFTELTAEQIEHMAQQDFSGLNGGDELIAEGYGDMARYLAKRNASTREKLAVDYAHTFLAAGNYETFAATPFESVFTSEMGLLMQGARDEVYKMYCAEHIQPDESLHVPEDHVSFEFQFLATLLERMNDALADGNVDEAVRYANLSRDFHEAHQLNWIDDLCDAVMDCAQTRFYRGVSKITRGFVHAETEVMDDIVDAMQ